MDRFIRFSLLIGFLWSLQACYLINNAYYLNNLYNSRRKIDDMLNDRSTPQSTREKLLIVKEILAYAKKEGLNTEDKYQEYIEVGDRPLSYIVEAAEIDQLKQITWWFPVVGDVPYLGYLEKKERDEKAESLRLKGYDIYESEAEAFSGLGWLRDPILSSYLKGSTASLANLLFHELTHATLWIPGSVEFNENLASFVGDILTIKYLQSKSQLTELNSYSLRKSDREKFNSWLTELRKSLDNLYQKRGAIPRAELLVMKKEVFSSYLREKRPHFSSADYIGKDEWNNAVVLAASLYISKADKFAKAWACVGDLQVGQFLKKIKETNKSSSDPFQALESLCAVSGSTP